MKRAAKRDCHVASYVGHTGRGVKREECNEEARELGVVLSVVLADVCAGRTR